MKIYIYNKIIWNIETWFLSETFGTIRHLCEKFDVKDSWKTMNSDHPCPYCGERCPDMLILGAKIGTFPLPNGDWSK